MADRPDALELDHLIWMEYAESAPPPELADIIRRYWHLQGDGRHAPAEPALPDGCPELILNFGAPFEYLPDSGRARRQPAAFLVGQISKPFTVRPTGPVDLLGVRFESHGASILHRPMNALTDRWRPIASLRAAPLVKILSRLPAASAGRREAMVSDALIEIRRTARAADERVARVVRAIRASHGTATLDELAREGTVTMRTLQRLFASDVGLSPKALARIARFQRVFATARDHPQSLVRVAAQCGYFDQSHLVRDFRALGGDAPARMLSDLPEFTAFFVA